MVRLADLIFLLIVLAWALHVAYAICLNTIGWLVRMNWWFPKTVSKTMKDNQARRDIEMKRLDKIIDSRSYNA